MQVDKCIWCSAAAGTVSTLILLLLYAIQCSYGKALTIPTVTSAAHLRIYSVYCSLLLSFRFVSCLMNDHCVYAIQLKYAFANEGKSFIQVVPRLFALQMCAK